MSPFGEARTLGFNNQPIDILRAGTTIINKNGIFLFSSLPPAKGNLVMAFAPNASGTIAGNAYPQGFNFGVWDNTGTLKQHFGINTSGDMFLVNSSGNVIMHGHTADGSLDFYSALGEGLNNLLTSITPANGTDSPGNATLQGTTVYGVIGGTHVSAQLNDGIIAFYTATSSAGPWTQQATLELDAAGNLTLSGNANVTFTAGSVNPAALFMAGNKDVTVISGRDQNTYSIERKTLILGAAFTINSTSAQTIFSVPLSPGVYKIVVEAVTLNTTAADAAGYAFAFSGTVAAPVLVKFESKSTGTATVGYAASGTLTTQFNGQGVANNQDLIAKLTINVATAGTLTFTGLELVAGNTIAMFAGSSMDIYPQ